MPEYVFEHLNSFRKFKMDKKTAIITDIDGTISEIAPSPDDAMVKSTMKDVLGKLTEKFELVAVISGRCAREARMMVGVDGLVYIGNHGLEYLKDGQISVDDAVENYIPIIKKTAKNIQNEGSCNIEGVLFEDKGACFSIHYRLCEDQDEARKTILNALKNVQGSKDLIIKEGRKIVEIRPPIGHDKGTIVQKLVFENNLRKIIYLGDDVTDLDAFYKIRELIDDKRVEGEMIVVLSREIPDQVKNGASFFVKSVDEVQRFFNWLLED